MTSSGSIEKYEPGDSIGRYEVVRLLWQLGPTDVYLAKHKFLNRLVTIKFPGTAHASKKQDLTFFKGANLAAGLEHPHLNQVLDVDLHGEIPYLVESYCEGSPLHEFLGSHDQVPLLVGLRIMADIASAAACLHRANVIHRDIKPMNIIVSQEGVPVLCNFEAATATDSVPPGQPVGTPPFMSPEQVRGETTTPESDVWCIGATMYQLGCGEPPYTGDTFDDIYRAILSEQEVDMEKVVSRLPPFVADIIRGCLKKRPEDRFRSADALVRALRAAIDHLERSDSATLEMPPPAVGHTILLHVEHTEVGMEGAFRQYEIVGPLGEGAFGHVYEALDLFAGERVALKFLKPEWLSNENAVSRFRRESAIMARLTHGNLVQLRNYGRFGISFFIAMELLQGDALDVSMRCQESFPFETAAAYGAQMLSGLSAMHEAGVVHRDIKPANLRLSPSGLKVCDFGLASDSAATRITQTHTLLGTATYMSPEQASLGEVSTASDVYSAGVVLFELLTSRRPHESDTIGGLLYAIANTPPMDASVFRDDIPGELKCILDAMLLRDRSSRPSASEAAEGLAAFHMRSRK